MSPEDHAALEALLKQDAALQNEDKCLRGEFESLSYREMIRKEEIRKRLEQIAAERFALFLERRQIHKVYEQN